MTYADSPTTVYIDDTPFPLVLRAPASPTGAARRTAPEQRPDTRSGAPRPPAPPA